MAYTVEDIVSRFRSDVFDVGDVDDGGVVRDTLWSAEDVLAYLNEACVMLATDTLAIRRRFEFQITAGEPLVRFPLDEILDELSITFSSPTLGRRRVLRPFDIDEPLEGYDDYGNVIDVLPDMTRTGMPTHFTRDFDNQFLRLYPIPYVDGVVSASAIAVPQRLYDNMPLPFQSLKDQALLLLWMKALAYAKQDADVQDLARAREFANEYKARVKDRASEIDRLRRDGGVMRPVR